MKGDVAAVDPADLKAVRALTRGVQAAAAMDIELYRRACGPGADVEAVWYRASMLGLLDMLPNVATFGSRDVGRHFATITKGWRRSPALRFCL